jgi:hypothetical protein
MVVMVHISTVHAMAFSAGLRLFSHALGGRPESVLDLFAVGQTRLVTSYLLLQRIGKRALPVC